MIRVKSNENEISNEKRNNKSNVLVGKYENSKKRRKRSTIKKYGQIMKHINENYKTKDELNKYISTLSPQTQNLTYYAMIWYNKKYHSKDPKLHEINRKIYEKIEEVFNKMYEDETDDTDEF